MMTTLSSLAEVVHSTAFSDTEPVFVLIDENVRASLLGLEGQPVVWTTVSVTGDRLLHAVILTTTDDNPLHFLWVGTIYSLRAVLEWLRRHDGSFAYVGAEYPDVHAEIFALLRHILGTFAVLTTA